MQTLDYVSGHNLKVTLCGKFNQWSVSSFLIRLLGNDVVISITIVSSSSNNDKNPYALHRLQRVMNAAARMLCGAGEYSRVTGLMRDRLHWLLVAQRIQFKLCLLSDDLQSDAWTGPCI